VKTVLKLCLGLLCALPCAAQSERREGDRWQLTLDSGRILWDLQLVKLAGDTLVVRHADSTVGFPIGQLDELRLVQKSKRSITPEAGRYGGVLGGADDEVYRLTLYGHTERLEILRRVFQDHPPPTGP
jgi:hypothetical protein